MFHAADDAMDVPVSKRLRSQLNHTDTPSSPSAVSPTPAVVRIRAAKSHDGDSHGTKRVENISSVKIHGSTASHDATGLERRSFDSNCKGNSHEPRRVQRRSSAKNCESMSHEVTGIERRASAKESKSHQDRRRSGTYKEETSHHERALHNAKTLLQHEYHGGTLHCEETLQNERTLSESGHAKKCGSSSHGAVEIEHGSAQSDGMKLGSNSVANGHGLASSMNHLDTLEEPDTPPDEDFVSTRTRTRKLQSQASSVSLCSAGSNMGTLTNSRQERDSTNRCGSTSRQSRARSKGVPKRIPAAQNPGTACPNGTSSPSPVSYPPQMSSVGSSSASTDALSISPVAQHQQQTPPKSRLSAATNSDEIATFYTSLFSPDSVITRSKAKGSDVQVVHVSPAKLKAHYSSTSPIKSHHLIHRHALALQRSPGGPGNSPELLSPTGTVDISVECRTRKSFSYLDMSGGGCGGGSCHDLSGDTSTSKQGEMLTSNNVMVALKGGEEDCNEVFGTCLVSMDDGGVYDKSRMERVMSITIETCQSEDGRRASEIELAVDENVDDGPIESS